MRTWRFSDGASVWFSSGRYSDRFINPMPWMEIYLLQSKEIWVCGDGTYIIRAVPSSIQEMVWRSLPDFHIKILSLHIWAWKNQSKCSDGLLYISSMGSPFLSYTLLCDCSCPLLTSWCSLISKGMHFHLVSLHFFVPNHMCCPLQHFENFLHRDFRRSSIHETCLVFSQVSSLWFIPFGYVFIARNAYSLIEALRCKETIKSWCNSQRMLLYKRTTSYFFALIDSILLQLGFSQTNFVITAKVDDDDDILNRYKNGIMEFGSNSIMFTIISTIALLNLLSLVVWGIFKKIIFLSSSSSASSLLCLQQQLPQIILCGLMVMINLPVYEALFFRTDKGRIPTSVFNKSIIIAAAAAAIASFICF